MSNTTEKKTTLTIRQQNMNKSDTATLSMINTIDPADTDIIAIQEPYFDFLNRTRATRAWVTVLPNNHYKDNNEKTRAIMLVNSRTQEWEQVRVDSPDVVAIKVKTEAACILIINLYCDINHSEALTAAAELTTRETQQTQGERMEIIWLGDFNCHHPLWDEPRNGHLFTNANLDRAQELIDWIDELNLHMILPANIPTLRSLSTGNLTRPDNVFATEGIVEAVLECNTAEDEIPPKTDHFPIITKIGMDMVRKEEKEVFNFKLADWEKFREVLKPKTEKISTDSHFADIAAFDTCLSSLVQALQDTIREVVPRTKITAYTKRWWTKELTNLNKELRRLKNRCKKRRHDLTDPIHEEERVKRNKYVQAIRDTKQRHWENFLEELDEKSIWIAHKYVTNEPTDGGKSKLPPLKTKEPDGSVKLTTSEKEKADLLFRAFFTDDELKERPPKNFQYPPSAFTYKPISNEQIHRALEKLSPYKAPGANGIPNVVLTKSAELIIPIIGPLFREAIRRRYIPQEWKDSTIVVVRKPGKPDYAVTGAYRPIALLDTMGKVLASCIADDLTTYSDSFAMLPPNQFGCRPGRTTSDALHLAINFIKNAWRGGDEVMALFLDIKAAFPSVIPEWLQHNLRKRGFPKEYIAWYREILSGRKTTLTFDNYKSEPLPLTIGLDQGRPDSGIAYALYSADLAEIVQKRRDREAVCFADDTTFLVRAKTLEQGVAILKEIMEEAGRWSGSHNCLFATEKFAAMGFSRRREIDPENPSKTRPRKRPSVRIGEREIKPVTYHKFLGIMVDEELRFKIHTDYALKKGTMWVSQFKRLAKPTKGVAMRYMRRYYMTVAVPRMLYAADVFLVPESENSKGSKGMIQKLARIQREAAIMITGAMKTTASDTLDAHADLIPFPLLVEKLIFRAATRLATLPDTHALTKQVKRAANRYVRHHKSPLHEVMHRGNVNPNDFETIKPNLWGPRWTPKHTIEIAKNRDVAKASMDKYQGRHIIFSDGSGRDGKIGAAATFRDRRGRKQVRRKLLGGNTEHTVYEVELAGIILALDIAKGIRYTNEVVIMLDNQAAILATTRQRAAPGQELVEKIQIGIDRLNKKRRMNVILVWVPGHEEIEGNEDADEEAGKAITEGDLNSAHIADLEDLPKSISAARQHFDKRLKEKARRMWEESPRFQRMRGIDESMPSASYLKMTDEWPRNNVSVLTQMRTGHAPLNYFLHKIGKADDPTCPACEMERETVSHFLTNCPRHDALRLKIQRKYRQRTVSKKTLLSSPRGMKFLFEYVNETRRLEKTFGTLKIPKDKERKTQRGKS